MENINSQIIKRIVLVYALLATVLVGEFWVENQDATPIESKFILENKLAPTFGLFVRDYNLWKFSNVKLTHH